MLFRSKITEEQAFFPRLSAGSVKNHGLFPVRADADDAQLGPADLGDLEKVVPCVLREIFPLTDGICGRFPARHLDANRLAGG